MTAEDAWAAYRDAQRVSTVGQQAVVSIICTIGWHGAPCDEARNESRISLACDCTCHTPARTETP